MSRREGQNGRAPRASTALVRLPLGSDPMMPPPPSRPTLRDLTPRFLMWFRFVRERAEHTVTSYGFDLQAFLAFCDRTGLTWPGEITFREVEMFMAWLRHERGLKPTTCNRHLHALRTFWRWLIREGFTLANPAADVESLKTPERLPRFLPVPEQERCLTELAKDGTLLGRRDHALIATLLLCGLRCSEVAGLKVEDVDLEAGMLRVIGKGNKQRPGEIVPRLRRILRDYVATVRPALGAVRPIGHLRRTHGRRRKGNVWLAEVRLGGERSYFSTHTTDKLQARVILADRLNGLRVEQRSPYLFLRAHRGGSRFRAKAGLPLVSRAVYRIVRERLSPILGQPIHPHQLRHSFASRMREHDAPVELVMEALGHADIRTTMIYAHISGAKRKRDIERFLEGPEGDQS